MPSSKVALVTGAGRRLGRAIAFDLAGHGWHVVLHHNRSAEEAEACAAQIRAQGGRADTLQADLGDFAQLSRLIPRCIERAGAPRCLVNNASLFLRDAIGSVTAESWQAHLDVNLRAPVFLAQDFAAVLPDGAEGCIVNIIDQRMLRPRPDFFSYAVAKAGLWWATQTLAQALAPRIRVNAVAPGPTLRSIHQSEAEFEAERRSTLLGRGAEPDEIAAGVRFILETPSLTGQMITLDGGQHLS
jgi:NAD(P)-dependent dehydrogenase (short-subunit alcohol dehydrogenase family)